MSWARFENVREVTGLVHGENRAMLKMATELGFELHPSENEPAIREVIWCPQVVAATAPQPDSQKRAAG